MAKAIVIKLSPRRWAVATSEATIGGIPVFELDPKPTIFANSIDALSAARRLQHPARAGKDGAGKEGPMTQDTERTEGAGEGQTTPPPAEGEQKSEGAGSKSE